MKSEFFIPVYERFLLEVHAGEIEINQNREKLIFEEKIHFSSEVVF